MEIGLHLPSAQPGASAAGILEVARAAERLGFDALWLYDHLFTPVDLASRYPYGRDYPLSPGDPFFDPLAVFGVLAGATTRVKLATGVLIAAYRHPIVLGKVIASIERFAPGRLILGLGAGWMEEEFRALGVPFDRRGARFDEHLAALRAIWSGEAAAFAGEFYGWPKAGFLPAPSAPIPLLVGGHSDAALRRAARHGDGWVIATGKGQGAGIEAIAARLDVLRRMLREEGREGARFELVCQNALLFGDTPSARHPFSGPPEAIAEAIRALAGLGVTMIDLAIFGSPGQIVEGAQRFVEEVRPLI
jgi:probable F420-dependent oxidoreductase